MTKQESFKRRIRERMAKTGERYGAARRSLLTSTNETSETPDQWVSKPDVEEEALHAATGRGWNEWCRVIDAFDGRHDGHTAIATFVREGCGVDSWWAQTITVGYERIRGLRLPYQNHDGTFTASRTRTVSVDAEALRDMLLVDGERALLFPAFPTRLRSKPTSKNIRLAIESTTVEIAFSDASAGRTKISVAHSKLESPAEVEIWKQFWTEWIEALDDSGS